jgi:hypothetical protein
MKIVIFKEVYLALSYPVLKASFLSLISFFCPPILLIEPVAFVRYLLAIPSFKALSGYPDGLL